MKNKSNKACDTNESSYEFTCEIKNERPNIKRLYPIVAILLVIIIALAVVFVLPHKISSDTNQPKIVTISTLQEIVNISKLSTVQFVYNGSAKVDGDNKTDYHVSYDSIISIGIDFDKVSFESDLEAKKIYVTIPEPEITDISVDIESLDFIFNNKKADKLTTLQSAYEVCIEDARAECEANEKMFSLAEKSIEDAIRALTEPIIDEFSETYTLEFRRD